MKTAILFFVALICGSTAIAGGNIPFNFMPQKAKALARYPGCITFDGSGSVYFTDEVDHVIRMIEPNGTTRTIAGLPGTSGSTDGAGTAARFNQPHGIVYYSNALYVTDTLNNSIRRIALPSMAVTTFAGSNGISGSTDGSGGAARFNNPKGIVFDGTSSFYVADRVNQTIRKVTTVGVVTTFAGTAGLSGVSDGTGAAARFSNPFGLAFNSASNELYVSDFLTHTIRKITSTAVVTTFAGVANSSGAVDATGTAARFSSPSGLTLDSSGNLYVADYNNYTIRKISPAGVVTTVAGAAGLPGSVDGAFGTNRITGSQAVAYDSSSNTLIVSDADSSTLRRLSMTNVMTTFVGIAGQPGSADGQ